MAGGLPFTFPTISLHVQALGGSTNAIIHLVAIAGRGGVRLDLDTVDRAGRTTPLLADLKPVGTGFMEDFHHAGALPVLLRRRRSRLDLNVVTADGRRLGDVLDTWPAWTDDRVIRPLDNSVAAGEALAVLRGSLAANGAVLKRAAASGPLLQHEGLALVFEGLDDLAARLDDPALPVTPDTVLVLRGIEPIGAGMPEAGSIPIPAKLARAGVKDMVRISDARMSGTAYGTVILHVSPESAAGGPLALVRNGDRIRLDTAGRRLDLLVDDAELERRRGADHPSPVPARGYAHLHGTHVLQADRGCDLDFLV
jgi:dihydroxy-acid dehydratase